MFENGLAMLENNRYCITTKISDINYQLASDETREDIFASWMEFLNAYTPNEGMDVTIHNHSMEADSFSKEVLLKHNGDELDVYRDEMNHVLTENMKAGNNNIISDKYLTFAIQEESIDDSLRELSLTHTEIMRKLKAIGCFVENKRFMDGKQRLDLLNDIMTPTRSFHFDYQHLDGTTTKDALSPDRIDFSDKTYFMIDDRYCKVLFLKSYSTEINDEFIAELSKLQYNFTINFKIRVMDNSEALQLVMKQKAAMERNKADEQKKAYKMGYSEDMIPEEIKYSLEEADILLKDVKQRNQRLFQCQFVILLNCAAMDELNELEKRMRNIAKKHNLDLGAISYLQELGLQAALPLCYSKLPMVRTLPTSTTATFIPFTSNELIQRSPYACYYGINAVTGNLILCDRTLLLNQSGWILGTPGSGKSFGSKREITYNLLKDPNTDVIVIDPEAEYTALAKMKGLDAAVIHINNTSGVYLNPLAGDIHAPDFVAKKTEFLLAMVSLMIGSLNPISVSLVDRVSRMMYMNFEEAMSHYEKKGGNKPHTPTVSDFYDLLKAQEEKEAKQMARAMEIYVHGSNNFFSKNSNVDVDHRMVIYNIRDLPNSMKPLAMLVITESLWDRIIENRKLNKRTLVYVDEFYLMMQNEHSMTFFKTAWKRVRKLNAGITGITQNVEEILRNPDARTMLSNSEFILMMKQAKIDREELAQLFNISEEQMSYISNNDEGSGLLFNGKTIIPFYDNFPRNTKLYRIMTTKPTENMDYE